MPYLVIRPETKSKRLVEVRAMALSPDQKKLAAGLKNGELHIFELDKFEEKGKWLDIKDDNKALAIEDICYSPNGKEILLGCSSGYMAIVHGEGQAEDSVKIKKTSDFKIKVVRYSPKGDRIFGGCEGGILRSIRNDGAFEDSNVVIEHKDGVCALAYCPSLKKYASGGCDKVINLFTLDDSFEIEKNSLIVITKHTGIVRSITFSADGTSLLSASYDKTARLFESSTGNHLMAFLGHSEPLISATLSPDGRYVLTGSQDNTAKLYDRNSGELLADYASGDKDIRCVQFFRDGSTLIQAGEEGLINFFSIREDRFVRKHARHMEKGQPRSIFSLDIASSGEIIATGGDDGTLRIFEVSTGFQIKEFYEQEGSIYSVKFSPDGHMVLSGGLDSTLRVYDINTGALITSLLDHKEYISTIEFSKSGMEFASGSADKTINVYDYCTLEKKYSLPEKTSTKDFCIFDLVFTHTGKSIICVGEYEGKRYVSLYSKEFGCGRPEPVDSKSSLGPIDLLGDGLVVFSGQDSLFIFKYQEPSIQLSLEKKLSLQEGGFANERALFKSSFGFQSRDGSFIIATVTEDEDRKQYIDKWTFSEQDNQLEKAQVEKIYDLPEGVYSDSNLSFFPREDQPLALFGTEAGVAHIINLDNKAEVPFAAFSDEVEALSLYNMGPLCAVSLKKGAIRIVDTVSGLSKKEFRPEEGECFACLRYLYSGSNQSMLVCGGGSGLWFYDCDAGFKNLSSYKFNKSPKPNKIIKLIQMECIFEERFIHVICGYDCGTVDKFAFNMDNMASPPIIQPILTNKDVMHGGPSIMLLLPGFEQKTNHLNCIYICFSDGSILRSNFLERNKAPIQIQTKLKDFLTCASSSPDFTKIISGANDKIVRVFEINRRKEKLLKEHEARITAVGFLSDESYVISASLDGVLKVCEIESETVIYTYKASSEVLQICSNRWIDSVTMGTRTGLVIIDRILNHRGKLETFCKLYDSLQRERPLDVASLLKNECYDMIPVYPNLSFLNILLTLSVKGKSVAEQAPRVNKIKSKNYTYIQDRARSPRTSFKVDESYWKTKAFKNTEILRGIVDVLYSSMVSAKNKDLLAHSIFKKDSVFDISPWDIWMSLCVHVESGDEKRALLENLIKILTFPDIDGVHKISRKYNFLQEVAKEYPGHMKAVLDAFWSAPSVLTVRQYRMNSYLLFKYYATKFYRVLFNKDFKRKVNITFPMVLACSSPFASPRVLEQKYEQHCKRLDRFSNLNTGYIDCQLQISEISLDEIINLNEEEGDKPISLSIFREFRPEDNLFKSELLSVVVEYLWRLDIIIGVRFYRRMFYYVVLEVVIVLNCFYFIPGREISVKEENCQNNWITWTIIFDFILIGMFLGALIVRIIKFREARKNARKNNSTLFDPLTWIVDFVISVLGIVTFSFDIHYGIFIHQLEDEYSRLVSIKILLASLFAISWFRLMEFARGIKRTSALVRILEQVTNDMIVYLLIILFMIIGLALTIFLLQDSYGSVGTWYYFKTIYFVLLGDFGDYKSLEQALNNDLNFVILFIATVYLVIIMLNLLIAIVSNSFSNVISNQRQNEVFEKLKFIHDRIYNLDKAQREILKKKLKKRFFFQLKSKMESEADASLEIFNRTKLENIEAILVDTVAKQGELETKIQALLDMEPAQAKYQKELAEKINSIQESVAMLQRKPVSDNVSELEMVKASSMQKEDAYMNKLNQIERLLREDMSKFRENAENEKREMAKKLELLAEKTDV